MRGPNIVSVSWGDHLEFGDRRGRLATPGQVREGMARWRDELAAGAVHWRTERHRFPGTLHVARGQGARGQGRGGPTAARPAVDWDDLETVPALAHEAGLEAWRYVALVDEAWPLAAGWRERLELYSLYHVMNHYTHFGGAYGAQAFAIVRKWVG